MRRSTPRPMSKPIAALCLSLLIAACSAPLPAARMPADGVLAASANWTGVATAEVAALLREGGGPVSVTERREAEATFAGVLQSLTEFAPPARAEDLPTPRAGGQPAFHVGTSPQRND